MDELLDVAAGPAPSTWETTAQGWGGMLVDRWSAATYQQPAQLQAMQLQARGANGAPYTEGKAGVKPATVFGVPPMVLMLGVGVLAVVLMMRKG